MENSLRNECPLCGNDEYCLKDGFYYCTLCQTQSQNLIQMDYSEVGATLEAISRGKSAKKKKKKEEETKLEEVPLSPYALYEAYAFIFDRLADAFVRLGVPKSIKEALRRLYALYLRRRGVAFLEGINSSTTFRSKFLTIQSVQSRRVKRRVTIAPKLELDKYILEETNMANQADRVYADIYGGLDSPLPSSPARRKRRHSEIPVVDISDDEGANRLGIVDDRISLATRLQPNLLISFCYLACLAVCPQTVLISDLLRWTKENLLPIRNAYSVLPAHLNHKLIKRHFGADVKWAHGADVISIYYRRALWLSIYIGYTPVVKFDIEFLLARFAYDLNLTRHVLPRARLIYGVASKFLQHSFRFDPREDELMRQWNSPATPPETAAVAILIVALKMTFGLDDRRENIISRRADKAKTETGQFSFCRWQLQCKLRTAVVQGESIRRVLSRSWIDKRDTWIFDLMKQVNKTFNDNSVSLNSPFEIDSEDESRVEEEFGSGRRSKTVDVAAVCRLFEKFTPFVGTASRNALGPRKFLYPMRETADQLEKILVDSNQNDLDSSNVKLFGHDFFNDSLAFLGDLDAIDQEVSESSIGKDKRKLIDVAFPCAEWSVCTGKLLADKGFDQDFRIANMMESDKISVNTSWLLKMCRNRLNERMWVLFRAVQRIELCLLDDDQKSAKIRRMLNVL